MKLFHENVDIAEFLVSREVLGVDMCSTPNVRERRSQVRRSLGSPRSASSMAMGSGFSTPEGSPLLLSSQKSRLFPVCFV